MLKEKQILEEVEKTLEAYDYDIVLKENPFLLTQLMAERESRRMKGKKTFAFKFSVNQILMILILLINLITLVYSYELKTKENLEEKLIMELKTDFQIDQSQNNF